MFRGKTRKKNPGPRQNKAFTKVNNSHKGINKLIVDSSFFIFSIEYSAITKKSDYFER